ncbi:MAG: glycosyltransferase [Comamonadaceae bacterium]|nr:MAG: glycosyltransferase [Comamonadaceae bacterium]
MIGIIVPAHDEEAHIEACVRSLLLAGVHPLLLGEPVVITVVADACRDRTAALARFHGVYAIDVELKNVGLARQLGAAAAVTAGARWLSFTDADSVVAPDWLVAQLSLGADAVCGTVAVSEWGGYGERMRRHFESTYTDADGHAHIHGANLGVSAQAYEKAGGFSGLETGEDVALVAALRSTGAHIAWSSAPRVVTSARANFRAPRGFGATLERIETRREWVGAVVGAAA